MENYTYTSYPGSGGSSPRSREIDFENPTPWEEQSSPANYKVQFMCSYGGKIHPRPNDNQLSYIGGQNRIVFVDRAIKFSSFLSVLSSLRAVESSEVSFKYQLPGEDLDALISVTSDDDFEHMMTEFDRLHRSRSSQPARLRLFLFPVNPQPQQGSLTEGKLDQNRLFLDALNSGPTTIPPDPAPAATRGGIHSNVDFLLGIDKGNPSNNVMNNPLPPLKMGDPIRDDSDPGKNRLPDPNMIPVDIQRHIQDLQRLQLQDQQSMYRKASEENLVHGGGDYYVPKPPEKLSNPPPQQQANIPAAVPYPYWPPEKRIGPGFPASGCNTEQQPVYMIPPPVGMYHAPVNNQPQPMIQGGYYQVQRMNTDLVYGDQQQQHSRAPPYMYTASPGQPQGAIAAMATAKAPPPVYSDGDLGYTHVAYDSAGRKVFYTPAYPAAVNAEMMVGSAAAPVSEGKVPGAKVSSQTL